MNNSLFSHANVPLTQLKERAFNYRWASVPDGVIPLTAADPDFPVAQAIRQAIADYALEGVFSYGPAEGLPEFRQALASRFNTQRGYAIDAQHILPIDSVASAMYAVVQAFVDRGDEVIIFDPVDFLFEQSVLARGGKVVRIPWDKQQRRFLIERLPDLITDKTRMISVCNPHNPLGCLLTRDELNLIASVAVDADVWILNDEIWSDIVYSPNVFCSFHQLDQSLQSKLVTVYGYSKSYGLAGLRIGAIIAPNAETHQQIMAAAHVATTAGGASTLSQVAATTAMTDCQGWLDAFLAHLTEQRDYLIKRLNAMPGVHCEIPQATYLAFANIEATGRDTETVVAALAKNKVMVVPGNAAFFGPAAKGHIRICFATSREILEEGLNRMSKALLMLKESEYESV